MNDIPYVFRLLALVALALGIVWYDRTKNKGGTNRIWEYGFLFLLGAIGAIYGAVNDAVTSGISSVYFTIGKGVEENESFRLNAVIFGAQVGFSAGVISCAIWQFFLRRVPPRQRCLAILRYVWIPFVLAALSAVALSVLLGGTDPLDFASQIGGLLSEDELSDFLTVWWAHMGSYVGLLLGLVAAICLSKKHIAANHPKTI